MTEFTSELAKRRTFAIISHPDAGKTTITEKLLLWGNAIQLAGSVKGKRGPHARSDWMTIEQARGISVTSSVMQFPYKGRVVNLLDTPALYTGTASPMRSPRFPAPAPSSSSP